MQPSTSPTRIDAALTDLFAAANSLRGEVGALQAERDALQLRISALTVELLAANQQLAQRPAGFWSAVAALIARISHRTPVTPVALQPTTATQLNLVVTSPVAAVVHQTPTVVEPIPVEAAAQRIDTAVHPYVSDAAEGAVDPPVETPANPVQKAAGKRLPWIRIVNVAIMSISAVVVLGIMALTIGPLALPYRAYVVVSGSMEPTLPTGAVAFLQPVEANDILVDDIITFQHPDRPGDLVTHRVIGFDESSSARFFLTKGDANGAPDSWRVPVGGSGWRLTFFMPFIGYVLSLVQSPGGRIGFLVVPAVILGALTLIDIWRPRPRNATNLA
jgi:signal peptidase I